jgi:glycosyltransferase involved in cell wall biosynthesis
MPRVLHVTTFARSGGGMQSLIRRHRAQDGALGFAPEVASIFETPASDVADLGLAATWSWSPRKLRARFLSAIAPRARDAVVVYHNAWAMPLLAPGDGAMRRVAFLHAAPLNLASIVPKSAPWCDAILCVNDDLRSQVQRFAPDFPHERVTVVALPVEQPADFVAPSRPASSLPRVGFVGRLERHEKRADRLPELMRHAKDRGLAAEWHVIGDGPLRAPLARATRGISPVTFHGWLSGADYWRTLAGLDIIVVLSERETGPLSLLEAMSCGVVPLYPRIGGLGETPARQVDAGCVYPAGNLAAAAEQLATLLVADLTRLRERARAAVSGYTAAAYDAAYSGALRDVIARPRHSATRASRAARLTDWLPLALVKRAFPDALWR